MPRDNARPQMRECGMSRQNSAEIANWLHAGQLALSQGDIRSASSAYLIAALFAPDRADVWTGLASSLGNPAPQDVLQRCVERILSLEPTNFSALMMRLEGLAAAGHSHYPAQAVRSIIVRPDDAEPYFFQARGTLSSDPERAITAAKRSLCIDPTDPYGSERLIGGITQSATSQSLSPAFVTRLFDKYADSYDDHLVEKLNYSGPQEIARALEDLRRPGKFTRSVDLGCGTGLCEPVLRPISDTLIGVDLSPAMLRQAQKSCSYDLLYEDEIVSWLENQSDLDLLAAAEVSPYIGDLDPLFCAITNAARDGAIFVLTYRIGDGDTFELSDENVYQHAPSYVRGVTGRNGWEIQYTNRATVHFAGGLPVEVETLRLHRA